MSYSNKLKIAFIGFVSLVFQNMLYSQDESLNRLYFYNWKIVNPAAAGLDGAQKFDINYISTFINLSDMQLSWETKLVGRNSGVGVIFENQQFGPFTRVYASALYNYQISFDEDKKLSFGTSFNFVSETRGDTFIYIDGDDVTKSDPPRGSAFDFGLGMAIKTKSFQGGVALRNVLQSEIYADSLESFSRNTIQHLTAYLEYRLGPRNFKFIPSGFFYTNYHYSYFDINPTFKLMNFFLISGGMRITEHRKLVNFSAGIDWKDKIQFSGIFYSTNYYGAENGIEFRLTIKP